jgi:hypothetical protein
VKKDRDLKQRRLQESGGQAAQDAHDSTLDTTAIMEQASPSAHMPAISGRHGQRPVGFSEAFPAFNSVPSTAFRSDQEIILIDELTDDNKLWLLSMIEDELLVDLPLAPKHDDCEMAVTEVGELPEAVAEKENPFAVLASLKS